MDDIQDAASPLFTTPHVGGHRSVLVRARDLGKISMRELTD